MVLVRHWGNNLLLYVYDETGAPIGMLYHKASYAEGVFDRFLFERDVFGNVISVYNIETGAKVGSYCYDAWGNCTVLTNTDGIGALNPFRYRGYYLDTETNLYYLQTRYYDSYVGRFINADGQLNGGMQGCNLFSYCENNPVMYVDPYGTSIIGVLTAIVAIVTLLLIPSDDDQTEHYTELAKEKYNENTINVIQGTAGDSTGYVDGKLNITFSPDQHLIDVHDSCLISSNYEKKVIIEFIMNHEYYDPTIYGNSADTMLIEWSAHNFVYNMVTTFPFTIPIFEKKGHPNPEKSTRSVDFRKELSPDARRLYEFVTWGGFLPW